MGRKWRLLAGRNRTPVGTILLLGGLALLGGTGTEDGSAAVYASRSDGGTIHRYGGSCGEQHLASRHENYARDSFHPRPP